MKDFFDDFSGIVHIPGGAVEYENGVLVERKEKPLNKKPTCRVIARQKKNSSFFIIYLLYVLTLNKIEYML